MGMVLLEQSALLRELERWLGRPVRWVWVKSHSGNVHHNQVDRIAYRMASEGRETPGVASVSSAGSTPPWFSPQALGSACGKPEIPPCCGRNRFVRC